MMINLTKIALFTLLFSASIFSEGKIYTELKHTYNTVENKIKANVGMDLLYPNGWGDPLFNIYYYQELDKDLTTEKSHDVPFEKEWKFDVKSGFDQFFFVRYERYTEYHINLVSGALYANYDLFKWLNIRQGVDGTNDLIIYKTDYAMYSALKTHFDLNTSDALDIDFMILGETSWWFELIKARYESDISIIITDGSIFDKIYLGIGVKGLWMHGLTHEAKLKIGYSF